MKHREDNAGTVTVLCLDVFFPHGLSEKASDIDIIICKVVSSVGTWWISSVRSDLSRPFSIPIW